MSENIKNYRLTKTTPNNVLFLLHPVSNPMLTRKVLLTNRQPSIVVPQDWALGIFAQEDCYSLYRAGKITFDDNASITRAAYEAGVYFDELLDFTPATVSRTAEILKILESGNRSLILKSIEDYGAEAVKEVAIVNIQNLKQGVVNMLEAALKVQLVVDNDIAE